MRPPILFYLVSQPGVTKSNYSSRLDGERLQNVTSPSVVTGLGAKTYYFVVTGSNAGGESSESAEVSALPEVQLNPQANTQLAGGSYTYTSVNIPAGVTLTVTEPVVITVTGDATVDGTLTGDCQSIELRVDGDFALDGLLTNVCTAPPVGSGPGLTVVADGDLTIGSVVSGEDAIVSDGSILLTDTDSESLNLDPVFDTEASPPLAPRATAGPARQAGGGGANVNRPVRARRGSAEVRVARSGDVLINGDIEAADGTDAPAKVDAPVCDNTSAFGGTGGSVRLAAPNGRLFIGVGVRLEAGDGGRGGDCTAEAEGADAVATAGQGGNGGSVLVGRQTVQFEGNVTLVRGNGGPGGNAYAFGGDAENPCEGGYTATSTGGKGGRGGGIGYIIVSPGQIDGAPTEEGANGGKGGLSEATGGAGADCVCEMDDDNGGDGGMATATGGQGGDGAKGNIWALGADSHKKGAGGDADALGGQGGHGADCCDEKLPGGDGGKGGDAVATGGDMGTRGIGGDSKIGAAISDGGDGLGGGSGGTGGDATSVGDPSDEVDGEDGEDGELCADLDIWFIYFSSIPDGPIESGTDLVLNVYDHSQTTQTGTVVAHFQTEQEAGETTV